MSRPKFPPELAHKQPWAAIMRRPITQPPTHGCIKNWWTLGASTSKACRDAANPTAYFEQVQG